MGPNTNMSRFALSLAAVALLSGRAHADKLPEHPVQPLGEASKVPAPGDDEKPPAPIRVKWSMSVAQPHDDDDGHHLTLTWSRTPAPPVPNLIILRRNKLANDSATYRNITISPTQLPTFPANFLYPSRALAAGDVVNPSLGEPFDANGEALSVGKAIGEWTVVSLFEGNDGSITDKVEPDHEYVYVLVPAQIAHEPGTYGAFIGDAILTGPQAAHATKASGKRRMYVFIIAGALLALLVSVVLANKRASTAKSS